MSKASKDDKETEICPVCEKRQKPVTWKFCSKCRSEHARNAKLAKQKQDGHAFVKDVKPMSVPKQGTSKPKIGSTTPDGKYYL